jgi:hypothetical protein
MSYIVTNRVYELIGDQIQKTDPPCQGPSFRLSADAVAGESIKENPDVSLKIKTNKVYASDSDDPVLSFRISDCGDNVERASDHNQVKSLTSTNFFHPRPFGLGTRYDRTELRTAMMRSMKRHCPRPHAELVPYCDLGRRTRKSPKVKFPSTSPAASFKYFPVSALESCPLYPLATGQSAYTVNGYEVSRLADIFCIQGEAAAVAGWLEGLGLGMYVRLLLEEGWDCIEVRQRPAARAQRYCAPALSGRSAYALRASASAL